ncbi:uridine diphosphate glucose pyrophosphatase NUDT22-like isoform X2 [Daphnia pulicaria]|uniref:uridine diphosphate glucose pyrophosphatase NUDT22-like isoform X2 n=1 Tax=Daphnia pulicaria TaxID=35523 RepID=UPI001EE9B645|nr:uridine diphosphate glucose pyrophosphatase NUDT22-like isoform X2 [Daphnia pulicaria]
MDEFTFKTQNGTEGIEIINLSFSKIPIIRSQTQINFSSRFNNKSDNWIEKSIKLIWNEKCKNNDRLYNQSKFRFEGTNCNPFGKELVVYGTQRFNSKRSCLADPLGVGSLLLTSDRKFLFLKRAMWTGEDKGKLDRPGGHPEPDNVSTSIQSWTEEECTAPENSLRIREEVFDSVKCEIRDEVNLPLESLKDPLLLGVVRSLERLGRPSAEFLVLCSLTSKEVENLYLKSCQAEADESLGIVFLPEEKVRGLDLDQSIWHCLTDAACGAIKLYSQCYSICPS